MSELRRLLGVLRFKDDDDPERVRLTPVPSLARLDELTDAFRESGLQVASEACGPVAKLPPGVDLTAYRIIQEALTNAVRHAQGATASVRLTYEPSHLNVEVTNTAPPRPSFAVPALAALASGTPPGPAAARAALSGPGYGLAGIAERVASCGGSLALGPTADGGFEVTARLPLR